MAVGGKKGRKGAEVQRNAIVLELGPLICMYGSPLKPANFSRCDDYIYMCVCVCVCVRERE